MRVVSQDQDGAERWRRTRRFLNGHRHELSRSAVRLYPETPHVGATDLLTRPEWLTGTPVELGEVPLTWRPDVAPALLDGSEPESVAVRAERIPGRPYPSYAAALACIDRPLLFEDRTSYRLIDVELLGARERHLAFGPGRYFEGVNVGEAVAHEFAAASMAGHEPSAEQLPYRRLIGDPTDLVRRPVLPAITTLTLRRDRSTGDATFVLHWRDPAQVTHGGGLYQVMPVGVFQPSSDAPWALRGDFDLWRGIVREYSEEFLGASEDMYGDAEKPFDYDRWPLYRALADARNRGRLSTYLLGLGVDPLSLAADLLTVTVIDDDVFDSVFADLVTANAEGAVLGTDGAHGWSFTAETVERFAAAEPMQAAGAAVLSLAWQHRRRIGL